MMPPNMAPGNPMMTILSRASQIAQSVQNPQQLISQFFPGIPANMSGDPNQIIQWLQQTGRVTPQQMQMASQLSGMMPH